MTTAYPLAWPPGFPRTPSARRERSNFRTTYANALENVRKSLIAFGRDSGKKIADPILSSNVDFMGQVKDSDPGVAVWFVWDGLQVCIPVDRYIHAASNLQAIHHILEARRTELRHGTLALVRATFEGFRALPAPKHWAGALGVSKQATPEQITTAYRDKARTAHPDVGGSSAAMAELNSARDAALKELGA